MANRPASLINQIDHSNRSPKSIIQIDSDAVGSKTGGPNPDASDSWSELAETSMPVDPNERGMLWLQAQRVRGRKSQNLKNMKLSIFRYTGDNSRFVKAITIVKTSRL